MIRSTILGGIAALVLSIGAQAQVVPVNNTGCSGAPAITWQGQPQIGTTITFQAQWPASTGTDFSLMAIGYGTGNTQDWSGILPFCTPGACGWYLAPFNGVAYDLVVQPGNTVTMALPIPNSRALVFNLGTFYVQGLHVDLSTACFDMTHAVAAALSL